MYYVYQVQHSEEQEKKNRNHNYSDTLGEPSDMISISEKPKAFGAKVHQNSLIGQ